MTYLELAKQLKNKRVPPVCLLYGTETYFIQNLKALFIDTVVEDKENLATYDLLDTSIQEVMEDVETYPFFPGKKLIFAQNPVFLKTKPEKLTFEHQIELLEQYVQTPIDYSVLVLIAPYEKLDERKKILKLLRKDALVVECNPIKPYEVGNWIKNIATQLHITLQDDAIEMLETELATNLELLESELRKLAMFVGENGVVTKEIAESLISHTVNSSSLRLVDAVIERNLAKAITIYKDLEKMKEDPIGLIGLLAFQFRTLLRVKLLKQKGYSQSQMQKIIGVHPYVIKVALKREQQVTVKTLQEIINKLASTDETIKQGKMEKEIAFELLLYDINKLLLH